MRVLVAGAGGAIGGHLVGELLEIGFDVRAVDIKPRDEWWQVHSGAHNWSRCDLASPINAESAVNGAEHIYDLAERMGGISFISENRVECAESIEIGINLLRAADKYSVDRFFFSSSACIYPVGIQADASLEGTLQLREDQAWPAEPEEGYGFSKLYMEELCRHYAEEKGLSVRIARFHNIYGAPGSWNDGKEKSPAAICRKVAEAVVSGDHTINIWGDGSQVRSYLHVNDCVAGIMDLMASDYDQPVNIGSTDSVTINELVGIVETIAGVTLERSYDTSKPQGVAGRNADITLAKEILGWEPTISLPSGLTGLYTWIKGQVSRSAEAGAHIEPHQPTSGVPA